MVLSRTNSNNVENVLDNYNELTNELDDVKNVIKGFGIKSDLANENFEKEIKKYMLGIRSDLAKDRGGNYFGCIKSTANNGWEITDNKKLQHIFKIYSQIEAYKIKRYSFVFAKCEKELICK